MLLLLLRCWAVALLVPAAWAGYHKCYPKTEYVTECVSYPLSSRQSLCIRIEIIME